MDIVGPRHSAGGVDILGIWGGRRIWLFPVRYTFLPYDSVPLKTKITDVPPSQPTHTLSLTPPPSTHTHPHLTCRHTPPNPHKVGQIPFPSPITLKTEQLPVTVSIVARRGCDFMLLDLLEGLAGMGVVREVKVGREAF